MDGRLAHTLSITASCTMRAGVRPHQHTTSEKQGGVKLALFLRPAVAMYAERATKAVRAVQTTSRQDVSSPNPNIASLRAASLTSA